MPVERTEQIDYLYSATWAARLAQIHDNIFNKHVFYAYLTSQGRMKTKNGGGLHIEERLLYGKNNTFKSIGKGGTVALNPFDGRTLSKWQWKDIAGSIVRYRNDAFKNRGKEQMADLVDEDIMVAEMSMADEMTRQLFLDGSGNGGLDFDGLGNIIATDPTTGTVGGLDRASFAWWRNNAKDMSSLPFDVNGRDEMSKMLNNCNDGANKVDIIQTSKTVWEFYEQEVADIQAVHPGEGKRNKIADLGFDVLWFRQVPLVYDKNSDDIWTNRMYFINTDTVRIIRSDIQWLEMTPWEPVQKQPKDRVAYIISTGNLVCNNCRRNGVMFGITL